MSAFCPVHWPDKCPIPNDCELERELLRLLDRYLRAYWLEKEHEARKTVAAA